MTKRWIKPGWCSCLGIRRAAELGFSSNIPKLSSCWSRARSSNPSVFQFVFHCLVSLFLEFNHVFRVDFTCFAPFANPILNLQYSLFWYDAWTSSFCRTAKKSCYGRLWNIFQWLITLNRKSLRSAVVKKRYRWLACQDATFGRIRELDLLKLTYGISLMGHGPIGLFVEPFF